MNVHVCYFGHHATLPWADYPKISKAAGIFRAIASATSSQKYNGLFHVPDVAEIYFVTWQYPTSWHNENRISGGQNPRVVAGWGCGAGGMVTTETAQIELCIIRGWQQKS